MVIDLTCYRLESAQQLVEACADESATFFTAALSGYTGQA